MNYLENLNKEQLEAVRHIDGPCLVMAGAGSGKTKVLTNRIAYLIDKGVRPSNILAITFTNKAANEMKSRVLAISPFANSFIGTFHSFGVKIIRENVEALNLNKNFTILDADDSLTTIKRIIKQKNIDPKKITPAFVRNKISFIKNSGMSEEEISEEFDGFIDKVVIDVYHEYEKVLEKSSAVDFDDLLLKPIDLFIRYPEILDKYQDHYPYILVDEYQDTNPVQYKLCKLLSKKYRNIFVVGDMNQSIYSFRQADYRNILNFEKDFKDAKIIKLEQNYRSTQVILDAANSVIKNNDVKKDLKLWSSKKDGDLISYTRSFNERDEIEKVVDEINSLYSEYKHYSSFAILYRTNAQSRVIEEVLLSYKIPYKIYGGFSYLSRKEIKDLIAYLKLINNSDDEVSLRRIINEPKRGIGPLSLEKIEARSYEQGVPILEALESPKEMEFKKIITDSREFLKDNSLTDLIDYVLDRSGLKEKYENDKTLESDIRLENLMEFKSLTASFEKTSETENLNDFLNDLSLMTDTNAEEIEEDTVTLMTLHSAKGLEFDVVFLVGMEEGIFPHANSLNEEGGLDEERRLCYVGITRAKDKLFISNAKSRMLYGQESRNIPSRFIDEIDKSLIKTNEKILNKKLDNMYTNNNELNQGDLINHEVFGHGIVLSVDGDLIDVAFKTGVKKLKKNHKNISKL